MSKSRFDQYNSFLAKRHRWIIVAWVAVLLVMLSFLPSFFSSVSYNITGNFGGPTNTPSQRASDILKAQFPGSENSSSSSVLVVFQGSQGSAYSNSVKSSVYALNSTFYSDKRIVNYTGMNSVYDVEKGFLNSSLPSLLSQTGGLESNVTSINSGVFTLSQNLSTLSSSLFQLQSGINQTAQLVFGVPAGFVLAWEQVLTHGITDPYVANVEANASIYQATNNFGGDQETIGYYTTFFHVWNASFQSLPSSTPVVTRQSEAINQSVSLFTQNPQVNAQAKQIFTMVQGGLNLANWNESSAVSNLAINSLASSIPSSLTSSLGVAPKDLVSKLYELGPSPNNSTLAAYAATLFESKFSSNSTSGFSVSQLVNESYALGQSPSFSSAWSLAAKFIANATRDTFSGSPLFSVNSSSLQTLISNLRENSTKSQINSAINNVVENESFTSFPFAPKTSITQNFVDSKNETMIVLFNFASQPDSKAIKAIKEDVASSKLSTLGQTYVTGGAVVTQDVSDVFTPALSITIGPGVAMSIIIVGLLFLSPIAALLPILLGGISIAIALPTIYFGIVKLGHGTITFLTPTLTILLVLGLAVDYAVLQLRRTREERINGRSKAESVGLSVRWAGQAVLTAGITVIVAYIVMAVANVPLFSDVGTAIAIGVSILLAVSLTLLPSLELSMGDRLFWPSLSRQIAKKKKLGAAGPQKSRLERLGEATLRRKAIVAIVISSIAVGAFYTTYSTPTGADFLKLIPNFPSNQGLTVITNNMGSGTIAPAIVILTTPTPISNGGNQFNQNYLNQIEQISNAAANSSGVVSVSGPTRPYGSVFNYSSISTTMPEALRAQYLGGLVSTLGQDNKTALIKVGLSSSSESEAAINSLLAMEKNIDHNVTLSGGETLYFGGDTQSTYDSQSFLNGLLPEVVVILAAAVYVILLAQLRSAFTPLRLIFTILCSVVFSLALLSLIFYHILKLPILDFAPLFVVVTMLGVGIDYDIFFVTRIREEVLNGKSDYRAITTALDRVWVTILGLGLVLSTVFGSLIITGIAILQEIAVVVSAAIMIDVLVVILFFVPSLMGLAARANWWPSKIGKSISPEDAKEVPTSSKEVEKSLEAKKPRN